jgi:hypothetical protein
MHSGQAPSGTTNPFDRRAVPLSALHHLVIGLQTGTESRKQDTGPAAGRQLIASSSTTELVS